MRGLGLLVRTYSACSRPARAASGALGWRPDDSRSLRHHSPALSPGSTPLYWRIGAGSTAWNGRHLLSLPAIGDSTRGPSGGDEWPLTKENWISLGRPIKMSS